MTTPEPTETMAETEAVRPIDPTLAAVMTMFSQMQAAQEERMERREAKGRDVLSKRERKCGGDMKNYYSLSQYQCQQQIPFLQGGPHFRGVPIFP